LDSSLTSGLVLIGLLVVGILLFVVMTRLRTLQDPATLSASLQQDAIQAATMAEKLSQLEPVSRSVATVQVELRGLTERVLNMEQAQQHASRGVGELSDRSTSAFSELRAIAQGLNEATAAMRAELTGARTDLTEIKAHEKTDKDMSTAVAASVRRLETVLAGTQSKGAAGENILELIFANLPQEWQVRDFKVGGKPVEFGLKLPNNLIMPIDSKWPATDLLERFAASTTPDEQQRIQKEIEAAVLAKAREVEKYVEPSVTINIGVAVVPDAVYELCPAARVEAFGRNVAIISYSMFMPYLLLVYQTTLSTAHTVDMQRLAAFLNTIEKVSRELHDEIDGRLSRGITMLSNARDDLRVHAGRLGAGAMALKLAAPEDTPSIEDAGRAPAMPQQ